MSSFNDFHLPQEKVEIHSLVSEALSPLISAAFNLPFHQKSKSHAGQATYSGKSTARWCSPTCSWPVREKAGGCCRECVEPGSGAALGMGL